VAGVDTRNELREFLTTANRAVGLSRFGSPEVLGVVSVPVAAPGPLDALVRVRAAAVNPSDTLLRTGRQAERLKGISPPFIPGMDLAGDIVALGSAVAGAGLHVGQAVAGVVRPWRPGGGAQAQYVVVPASSLVPVPGNMSYAEAATVLMNGLTALVALELLDLKPGSRLLVTGGAGAFGGYAVSLARHQGHFVIADGRESDRELLLRLGAGLVVPRGEAMAAAVRQAAPGGVDGLVDAARLGELAVPLVRDGGTFIHARPADPAGGEGRIRREAVFVPDHFDRTDKIREAMDLARAGVLVPRVALQLPMEQAAEAHRLIERGGLRGRIVLTFDHQPLA
jgi:NADPH:quinone reductase-like Zn-dependent oxidoreductase